MSLFSRLSRKYERESELVTVPKIAIRALQVGFMIASVALILVGDSCLKGNVVRVRCRVGMPMTDGH